MMNAPQGQEQVVKKHKFTEEQIAFVPGKPGYSSSCKWRIARGDTVHQVRAIGFPASTTGRSRRAISSEAIECAGRLASSLPATYSSISLETEFAETLPCTRRASMYRLHSSMRLKAFEAMPLLDWSTCFSPAVVPTRLANGAVAVGEPASHMAAICRA
jgi:hypothetical protein